MGACAGVSSKQCKLQFSFNVAEFILGTYLRSSRRIKFCKFRKFVVAIAGTTYFNCYTIGGETVPMFDCILPVVMSSNPETGKNRKAKLVFSKKNK